MAHFLCHLGCSHFGALLLDFYFTENNGVVYYIDFECNDYMEEWDFENWGILYWSKTEEFLKYLAEHS